MPGSDPDNVSSKPRTFWIRPYINIGFHWGVMDMPISGECYFYNYILRSIKFKQCCPALQIYNGTNIEFLVPVIRYV